MVAAIEVREGSRFMASVAGDFAGPHDMDRDGLHRMVRLNMLQNQAIGVTTGPLDVKLMADRAELNFSALLTGGSGRLLPDQARTYQVSTGWRHEGGRWMLISARWE